MTVLTKFEARYRTKLGLMEKHLCMVILFLFPAWLHPCWSQETRDSIKTKQLEELTIEGQRLINIERLPPIEGTRIWSGKKNEVIHLQAVNANISEKTARQIFAKVPGVLSMIWMVLATR
jgi:Fe(3+) dicitrate transport protein